MIKPILIAPNDQLRIPSTDVVLDKKTIEVIESLKKTLLSKTNPQGVGLSAPQIGKNWNLFVTLLNPTKPEDDAKPQDLRVFLNPKVITYSKEVTLGPDPEDPVLEGCLSIPTIYGPVPRSNWVKMYYQTLKNDTLCEHEEVFSDFFARVIQHEYDHLLGKLFIDYSFEYELPLYLYEKKRMKPINRDLLVGF